MRVVVPYTGIRILGGFMIIDLKTKIIPENFVVYSLFPGAGYKHRQVMLEQNLVFLDFPDLTIPENKIGFHKHEFVMAVARSEAIAQWISTGRYNENKPVLDIQSYRNSRTGTRRGKYINSLQGLHYTAKKGELVVLPTYGHFGDIMIGEFLDEPSAIRYILPNEHYGEYKVPARRVKWIGKKAQHQVSEDFLKSIRSNPLVIVAQSDRRMIYDAAYSSYTLDSNISATFRVAGESFTSRDDFFFQEFTNYIAALCENAHSGDSTQESFSEDVFGAILGINDVSYIPDLSININSPGSISQMSSRITPLVVAAVLSLAQASCVDGASAPNIEPAQIEVTVSGVKDDPCAIAVEKSVRHALSIMGYEKWQKLCKTAQKLKDDPKLTPPASAEP